MFVKYNGVLRGLQSESFFLRNTMVTLCCPKHVSDAYMGTAKVFEQPTDGTLSFEQAKKNLNKYTTTLHAINSAIVKLGKLTVATKVYRGIAGMKLPDEFWQANDYDVKGGVEPAFMSTTLEENVAMGYAAGDGSKMGIVLEIRQGMVNRGANISWLSQYPHEQEILFGPLTGIEVLRTRIEGSVVVIECDFNINLTALTLEEVLGKRRKVVKDMCDQLALKARHDAQGESWSDLRTADEDTTEARHDAQAERTGSQDGPVEAFLTSRLMSLATKEPAFYNDNAPLGEAIREAVATADIMAGWPEELQALAKVAAVGADVEQARKALEDEASAVTVEQLMRFKGPLAVCLRFKKGETVPIGVVHGLCALMWVMQVKEAPLSLDLNGRKISADGLAALARGMAPSLVALLLDESGCANGGGNLSGLKLLCSTLASEAASGLKELRCVRVLPRREA